MKKFIKFAAGAAALAGAVCGVLYFMQKVLGVNIFKKDNDDIDDFDDDFDDSEEREYVTLDLEKDSDSGEEPAQTEEETTETTETAEA